MLGLRNTRLITHLCKDGSVLLSNSCLIGKIINSSNVPSSKRLLNELSGCVIDTLAMIGYSLNGLLNTYCGDNVLGVLGHPLVSVLIIGGIVRGVITLNVLLENARNCRGVTMTILVNGDYRASTQLIGYTYLSTLSVLVMVNTTISK